jgi:transposase
MPYPLKFRQHLLKIQRAEGLTFSETAGGFQVGIASVVRWSKKPEPLTTRNRKCKVDMDALAKDVETHPDDYQYEGAERFNMSARGMCDALKRLGISRKKNTSPSQGRRESKKGV